MSIEEKLLNPFPSYAAVLTSFVLCGYSQVLYIHKCINLAMSRRHCLPQSFLTTGSNSLSVLPSTMLPEPWYVCVCVCGVDLSVLWSLVRFCLTYCPLHKETPLRRFECYTNLWVKRCKFRVYFYIISVSENIRKECYGYEQRGLRRRNTNS